MARIPGIFDITCEDGFNIFFEGQKFHWDLSCPTDGDQAGWEELLWIVISDLLRGGKVQ